MIQDGAPELWNLIAEMAERHALPMADEVIDRFHLEERLAEVCEHTVGAGAARELYEAWRYQLDHSDTAIDRILQHLDALVWHSPGRLEDAPAPRFWRIGLHRVRAQCARANLAPAGRVGIRRRSRPRAIQPSPSIAFL